MAEIKARHQATGGHWFDPDTLRFFSSRFSRTVYPVDGGALFISSEQNRPVLISTGWTQGGPRLYSIRFCSDEGKIETIGTFQRYGSLVAARHAAKQLQEQRNAIN